MPAGTKISQDVIEKIIDFYGECKSSYRTAKKFGVNRVTVDKYVHGNNYKVDNARKLKKEMIEYKGGKCEICGYDKSQRAMTFHHKDPNEKDFMVCKGRGIDRIKAEVDKCMLLCFNCHQELHERLKTECAPKYTDTQLKTEILKLRQDGISQRKISKMLKCSISTVSKYCVMTEGIKMPIKRNIDEINAMQKYYDECKNHREVAKKFGCSPTCVLKYVVTERYNEKGKDKRTLAPYIRKTAERDLKQIAVESRGGKCEICGYNKSNEALVFHHINPANKKYEVKYIKTLKIMMEEIDKCLLLCANCHQEVHEKSDPKIFKT